MKKAKESKQSRKKETLLFLLLLLVGLAFIVGAILLQIDGNSQPVREQEVEKMFRGIPQEGLRLGSQSAPQILVEWGDMQCSACAAFAKQELPSIIKEEVRSGRLALEFRQWPILGTGATLAAEAALAASRQNRYWQFMEYYYQNQPAGQSPDEDFLRTLARVSGLNVPQWNRDRNPRLWKEELAKSRESALDLRFTGTPSFAIKEDGILNPLQVGSGQEIIDQLGDEAISP